MIRKVIPVAFMLYAVFFTSYAFVGYAKTDTQEGRYVMIMPTAGSGSIYTRATPITKTPAIVLDTILGIVWRCQNLQDEKPLWIKTDLGKNGNKPLTAKKYTIQMPDSQNIGYKTPAIVLDIEEGKVWACPNILDESAAWIQTDLVKDIKEEEKLGQPFIGQPVR